MDHLKRALIAVVALVTVAVGVVVATPAAYADGPFWLTNKSTESGGNPQCLLVQGTTSGTQAIQWYCHTFDDQLWTETSLQGGYMLLPNFNSSQCLRVTASHAVVQAGCSTTDQSQQWSWAQDSLGWMIVSRSTHLCLLASGGVNALATVWTCASFLDQRWDVTIYTS